MNSRKREITQKERRSGFVTMMVVTVIFSIYTALRIGYFQTISEVENPTLFTALMDFGNHFAEEPWRIFPTNFVYLLLALMIDMIFFIFQYQAYLIKKDTVVNIHGDAHFETDFDQYEKEFVADPKILSAYTKIKTILQVSHKDIKDAKERGEKIGFFKHLINKLTYTAYRNEEGKVIFVGKRFRKSKQNITPHTNVSRTYKKAMAECRKNSMMYTDEIYLSLNGSWCQRNTNSIIFGASGTGKSRYFLIPNILQDNSSIVITDPSNDVMAATGDFLLQRGYDIRCLNINDMTKSCRFNPLYYIRSTKDIAIIVNTFLENVNGEKKGGGDPFWDSSAKALLSAVIGYLYEVCPMEQRNLGNVLDMLRLDSRDENAEETEKTEFDIMFEELGEANPASFAYRQYQVYQKAPVKTRLSILISTMVNLAQLDIDEVRNLTYKDELDLDLVGDKKMAIFLAIPQADTTFTWLTAMFYSLLFKRLYAYGENRQAQSAIDAENGVLDENGKPIKVLSSPEMKVPVRFLIDECANVGKISNLNVYLATCRKYRISICPIFQTYSQIKRIYGPEVANDIVGNCDAALFLGGSDTETINLVHARLGKETVYTLSNSYSQGKNSNGSQSKQISGKDLLTKDQIERLNGNKCLLLIRAVSPFYTDKINLNRHINYKYIPEGGGNPYVNPFDITYEDEDIERNRIRKPDEEGYIKPQIIDSARRRTMMATYERKIKEYMEDIEYLKDGMRQATGKDKELFQTKIQYLENEIRNMNKIINPNSEVIENTTEITDFTYVISSETKSKDLYNKELLEANEAVVDNIDLSHVTNLVFNSSYSPEYEFDEVTDFHLNDILIKQYNNLDTSIKTNIVDLEEKSNLSEMYEDNNISDETEMDIEFSDADLQSEFTDNEYEEYEMDGTLFDDIII